MAAAVIRVGILTPHAAVGPEAELPAMAPGKVVLCVARVPATGEVARANPTRPTELRALTAASILDQAAAMLARGSVDVIGYASTSSGYAMGFDTEVAVASRLSRRLGIPVVATAVSAVLALRVLDVKRVALIDPPWFDSELNELGAAYFRSQGFDVISSGSAELSSDPRQIESTAVCEWASRRVHDDAEAVFIGGNGFRAAGAIGALEATIARPVLTSNQVLLWNLLAHARTSVEVSGYGRLFAHSPDVPMDADPLRR
jgi:maleate isomerase